MKNQNVPLIKYSKFFNKQFKVASLEIKIAFRGARELFLEKSNDPALRDHSLKKEFAGYRSIDITDDYRAIYRKTLDGKQQVITFYLIGTHDELYGR